MSTRFFSRNEHKVERWIRVILGLAILSMVFVGPRTPWALIGAVLLVTGLAGTCPLYSIFGFSTCSRGAS